MYLLSSGQLAPPTQCLWYGIGIIVIGIVVFLSATRRHFTVNTITRTPFSYRETGPHDATRGDKAHLFITGVVLVIIGIIVVVSAIQRLQG